MQMDDRESLTRNETREIVFEIQQTGISKKMRCRNTSVHSKWIKDPDKLSRKKSRAKTINHILVLLFPCFFSVPFKSFIQQLEIKASNYRKK